MYVWLYTVQPEIHGYVVKIVMLLWPHSYIAIYFWLYNHMYMAIGYIAINYIAMYIWQYSHLTVVTKGLFKKSIFP